MRCGVSPSGSPTSPGTWPAGSSLVTSPLLVLQSGLLAALGVAGLAWRRLPERTFLVGGALGGLLLLAIWHTGPVDSPLAPTLQTALDHGLAPLRNVHKFDPVLRVPLALGLAHLSARSGSAPAGPPADSVRLSGRGRARRAVHGRSVPGEPGRATRVVRGDPRLLDGRRRLAARPMRPDAPWWCPGRPAARPTGVQRATSRCRSCPRAPGRYGTPYPLSSAGNIRLLDSIEQQLADGTGGAGLAQLLSEAGISDVLARHDIVWARPGRSARRSSRRHCSPRPAYPGRDVRAAHRLRRPVVRSPSTKGWI